MENDRKSSEEEAGIIQGYALWIVIKCPNLVLVLGELVRLESKA
jgi:hypothetical protein